jgi:hypothetical protein
MKNRNTDTQPTSRGNLHFASICALGLTLTVAAPLAAHVQHRIRVPAVPDKIRVESGNRVFFVGHAFGTQNYVCLPTASGVAFQLFTPEATLFNEEGSQQTTHFFSPNLNPNPGQDPRELGAIRATWEDSRDTSTVWAKASAQATSLTDPAFVNNDAIAWVLLEVVGAQEGPTGGDKLTETTFIQRLNTVGGVAPSTGCASPADIGTEAFMPYTADYFFYRHEDYRHEDR